MLLPSSDFFPNAETASLSKTTFSVLSENLSELYKNEESPKTKTFIPPKPDPSGFFVSTLNQTGYMTTHLDAYSEAFIDYAAKISDTVLEIGAAYGVASLKALEKGASIIANDLSQEHLLCLQQSAIDKKLGTSKLSLMPGDIREACPLLSNFLGAILMCRVIHFFTGPEIEAFLAKSYRWLKPGGRLFIISETPYLGFLKDFIPEYEKNLKLNVKWPGYIAQVKDYIQDPNLPEMIHLMDVPILKRVLLEQGFIIEKIGYVDRLDFPPSRRWDGRESVGVIAYKPIISTDSRCP